MQKGFTMIELVLVVAILGILAAVAIPQFMGYRTSSYNSAAEADLRNIITDEETHYVTNNSYVNLAPTEGYHSDLPGLPSARVSEFVCASVTNASATDYTAKTQHKNGDITYSGSQSGNITETKKATGIYDIGC